MPKRNIIHLVALSDHQPPAAPSTTKWAILVQPKKVHKWFRAAEDPPAVLLAGHGGKIDDAASFSAILVQILLGENDVDGIEQRVQGVLRNIHSSSSSGSGSGSGSRSGSGSNLDPADSDIWLQEAITALQTANLIPTFPISEFLSIPEKSLQQQQQQQQRERANQDSPLEIDTQGRPITQASAGLEEKVAAMKSREKKQQQHGGGNGGWGFWISHGPNATNGWSSQRVKERNSWEREDDAYGGLM